MPSPLAVKYVQCRVKDGVRDDFAERQKVWSRLHWAKGFAGQFGGWAGKDPQIAVLMNLWQGEEALDRFQKQTHDEIYASSGQAELIASSEVSLWHEVMPMPGDLKRAVDLGGFLRIAEIELLPGHREYYLEAQRTVWNASLAETGVIGGVCCQSADNDHHFLVATVWPSMREHSQYLHSGFRDDWRRSRMEDDARAVTGRLVHLLDGWRVI